MTPLTQLTREESRAAIINRRLKFAHLIATVLSLGGVLSAFALGKNVNGVLGAIAGIVTLTGIAIGIGSTMVARAHVITQIWNHLTGRGSD